MKLLVGKKETLSPFPTKTHTHTHKKNKQKQNKRNKNKNLLASQFPKYFEIHPFLSSHRQAVGYFRTSRHILTLCAGHLWLLNSSVFLNTWPLPVGAALPRGVSKDLGDCGQQPGIRTY
jgi:hypothetical protein